MTVVSKKSCISISFCYFYSFSSVNFRCREGEYFNRYVRIQTEFQSTVYCPKNKKKKQKNKNELSFKTYILLVGNVDYAIGSVEIYFLVCTG